MERYWYRLNTCGKMVVEWTTCERNAGCRAFGKKGRRMADRLLYWVPRSGPARRAQVCLAEKGLEYESKQLDFDKGDTKGPDVLVLNPRGQVPTFRDGDIVVNESLAILQYFEETYPEPPLLPKDKPARAKFLVHRSFRGCHESANLLTKLYAAFFLKLQGTGTEEDFKEKMEDLKKELSYWEGYLKDDDYVAGPEFTLADVAFGPFVLAPTMGGAAYADFPNIRKYLARLNERPSFANTVPPPFKDPRIPEIFKGVS